MFEFGFLVVCRCGDVRGAGAERGVDGKRVLVGGNGRLGGELVAAGSCWSLRIAECGLRTADCGLRLWIAAVDCGCEPRL